MKLCFWTTSFQADNQALATYLSHQSGIEVMVAMDDPERYRSEPAHGLLPCAGQFVDRQKRSSLSEIEAFTPDCVIVDNHLPPRRLARRLLVLWHGYGWRVDDLGKMKRELRKLVGDVTRPNPDFRWQAFGPLDRQYRIRHSGLAHENVIALGSAYSDLLIPGGQHAMRIDKARVQDRYSINLERPTLLLGMTWHHGGALSHWGDDAQLHERLAWHVGSLGANLLIRMHDRNRYEKKDVERMQQLAARHSHVELKFKSDCPDSLVDLLVSEVMISNYSSFLNAFYHTRKPTIHINPMAEGTVHYHRSMRWGRVRSKAVADPLETWKFSPDDIGGLRADNFEQLLEVIARSLDDPACCAALSEAYNQRHITDADGQTCRRVTDHLRRWSAEANP